MPGDFDLAAHSLTRLQVATIRGMIFGSLAGSACARYARRAGRRETRPAAVLPYHHPSDPRRASATRSDGRKATRALTSAARLARSADRARFCLTRSEFKDLPHIKPEKGPTSLRSVWHRRRPHHRRCGTGIGPDRDITAFQPDIPRPRVSADPGRSSRPGQPRKPRLLDLERRIPARDRFAPDSPLEEGVMSELVSEKPKFPASTEYTGNFIRSKPSYTHNGRK